MILIIAQSLDLKNNFDLSIDFEKIFVVNQRPRKLQNSTTGSWYLSQTKAKSEKMTVMESK